MWSNSLWEQEHQEELYQAFMEECLSGGPENFISPVRQQERGAHTVSALAAGFILSGKQIKLCRYD